MNINDESLKQMAFMYLEKFNSEYNIFDGEYNLDRIIANVIARSKPKNIKLEENVFPEITDDVKDNSLVRYKGIILTNNEPKNDENDVFPEEKDVPLKETAKPKFLKNRKTCGCHQNSFQLKVR